MPNIEAYVDATVRSLGLQDVAHNKIGTPLQRGISGGQKRRVTIACSVVARPRVLVLDEPTSGLDSGSAHEVMASSLSACLWSLKISDSATFSQTPSPGDEHGLHCDHSPTKLGSILPLRSSGPPCRWQDHVQWPRRYNEFA